MSVRVALHHATRYTYDRLIRLGPQVIRLRPAPHCRTPILSYELTVRPADHFLNWQQDPQANWLARVLVPEATNYLHVTVDLVAELAVVNPFDFFLEASAERYPFAYDPALALELAPYLAAEPAGPLFESYLAGISRSEKAMTPFLFDVNAGLQRDIAYLIRMEPGIQTPDETLATRAGSCRDTAWLLVQLLRRLGHRGALRVGLSDPAAARRAIARRTVGRHPRLHRPARLVRSVPARRGMDRTRSDVRFVCG